MADGTLKQSREPPPHPRGVLIVDDHPNARLGVRRILESRKDFIVCAEASNLPAARSAIREYAPEVVTTEINFRRSDGIELVRNIRVHHPNLPILVYSAAEESIYAERLISIGANGYLMKREPCEFLLLALRCIAEGGLYVSDSLGHQSMDKLVAHGQHTASTPLDRLSNRELQVLNLVGNGFSTRETARFLNVTVKTIESHGQRIKTKLNLRTGSQLVQYAIRWFSIGDLNSEVLASDHLIPV